MSTRGHQEHLHRCNRMKKEQSFCWALKKQQQKLQFVWMTMTKPFLPKTTKVKQRRFICLLLAKSESDWSCFLYVGCRDSMWPSQVSQYRPYIAIFTVHSTKHTVHLSPDQDMKSLKIILCWFQWRRLLALRMLFVYFSSTPDQLIYVKQSQTIWEAVEREAWLTIPSPHCDPELSVCCGLKSGWWKLQSSPWAPPTSGSLASDATCAAAAGIQNMDIKNQ